MAAHARKPTSALIELHRHHWAGGIDLDVVAVVMALRRIDDVAHERTKAVWMRHGLTPAEFDVLATLRRSPPPRQLTPSQIQDAMLITSGGLTKAMAGLEAKGWVTRSRSETDQRVRPVKLSVAGKRLAERVLADLNAVSVVALRSSLDDRQLRLLTQLLDKLEAGMAAAG